MGAVSIKAKGGRHEAEGFGGESLEQKATKETKRAREERAFLFSRGGVWSGV
jgi:hypothetical protein